MRDNINSCNLLFMSDNYGSTQNHENIMHFNLYNHMSIRSKPSTLENKMINQKYKEASNCQKCIGLSNCSNYNMNGTKVDNPKTPFLIKLVPMIYPEMQNPIQSLEQFEQYFTNIREGFYIYHVYAYENPHSLVDDNSDLIGYIRVNSEFTKSK